MSPSRSPLIALAAFEFRRGGARQGARMGFALFIAALALGLFTHEYKSGQLGSMFGEGFLIWMMGLIGFGLAGDRRNAFDAYLIRNHVSSRTYLGAKIMAMVALIVVAGACAFVARVAFTQGDLAGSLWSATTMTLVGLMVAPLAMLIEAQADTSMPAAIIILGYGLVGGLLYVTTQNAIVFEVPGFAQLANGNWASLAPLATRSALFVPVGFLVAGWLVHLSLRRC